MTTDIDKLEKLLEKSDRFLEYLFKKKKIYQEQLVISRIKLDYAIKNKIASYNDMSQMLTDDLWCYYVHQNILFTEKCRKEYYYAYVNAIRHNNRRLAADTLIDLMKS